MQLNESTVEEAALSWFEELGYAVLHGPDIAPGEPEAEREAFDEVILAERLRDAIDALNPNIPARSPRGGLPQGPAPRLAFAGREQPGLPRDAAGRGGGRVSPGRWLDRRRPGAPGRLRPARRERLAGRQSVHGDRGAAQPPARHRGVRQRLPAGRDRTEERCRRGRDDLDGLEPAPDLQAADSVAVPLQRSAGRLRWTAGPHRFADGQQGMVQALADHRRRDTTPHRTSWNWKC